MTSTLAAAANRRGILYMLGAVACFVANDALVKFVSQNLPGLRKCRVDIELGTVATETRLRKP